MFERIQVHDFIDTEPLPSDAPQEPAAWSKEPTACFAHPKLAAGDFSTAPINVSRCLDMAPVGTPFLFKDVFPQGILAVISATGGTGKSLVCLQLAYSLASGEELLGLFSPVAPRKVMYLQGEDPVIQTRTRLHHIGQKWPVSLEKRALLKENLLVFSAPAAPLFSVVDGRVVPSEAYKRLQWTVTAERPALVILDPLSRWSGLSETNNSRTTAAVTLLEGLVKPHGGSILLAHHTTKSGSKSLGALSARGASALVDGSRLVISMTRGPDFGSGGSSRNSVLLDIAKNSYGIRPRTPATLSHCPEYGGILEQTKQTDGRIDLVNKALALADWVETNGPVNISGLRDPRSDRERDLHEFMADRCGSFRKDIADFLEVGEKEGALLIETVSTDGRPATLIRSACGVSGQDGIQCGAPEETAHPAEEPIYDQG